MTSQSFCIFLLVVFPYPAVFCRYDYFQHIHSHTHKGHSTKDALSSTTVTFEETYSSKQGAASHDEIYSQEPDDVSEEISSSEDIQKKKHKPNETVLQEGDPYSDRVRFQFVARIGIIVGSIVIIVACLGCIICCCPSCCRGKDRRGFIVGNAAEDAEACPQQQQPPPVVVQHFPPPQYTPEPVQQQFPPHYTPQSQYPPAHPFSQYSPAVQQPTTPQFAPVHPGYQYPNVQFYNPPEAPPPYEATAPPSK